MTLQDVQRCTRNLLAIEKFCSKLEKVITVNVNDHGVDIHHIRKAKRKYSKASQNHNLILNHIWNNGHIV